MSRPIVSGKHKQTKTSWLSCAPCVPWQMLNYLLSIGLFVCKTLSVVPTTPDLISSCSQCCHHGQFDFGNAVLKTEVDEHIQWKLWAVIRYQFHMPLLTEYLFSVFKSRQWYLCEKKSSGSLKYGLTAIKYLSPLIAPVKSTCISDPRYIG